MANFRLPGLLDGSIHTLEYHVTTLQRAFTAPPGTLHPHHAVQRHKHKHKAANKAKAHAVAIPTATKSTLTEADFQAAADALGPGISPAIVHAFAHVESGGKSGFGPSGLPIIAYEGHKFREFTGGIYDNNKDHPFLSYKYKKKAGAEWKHNNADQATAWKTLKEAMALNHKAALKATSWGMFQVMGFNHRMCGFKKVDDFVAAMKASEKSQLLAFVEFCKHNKALVKAMQDKNFAGMAKAYNGPDYGDYDRRMEKAYKKYSGADQPKQASAPR